MSKLQLAAIREARLELEIAKSSSAYIDHSEKKSEMYQAIIKAEKWIQAVEADIEAQDCVK